MADVAALFRYPVKSMGGERVDRVELTERGVAGDRSHAVVDRSDGRVVTGKHPRKWGRILELSAAYVDGDPTAPLTVTFPDGAEVRGDDPSLDGRLSAFLGAEVTLTSSATSVVAEEVWPADVEGLAPMDVVASMGDGRREGDDLVTDIPVASMAPPGTFFDLTTLHVLTEATLQRLAELDPEADFDVRRYRPNVLVGGAGDGFVENEWTGATLALGTGGAEARVDLPTMRCVLTTLAQPGLAADRRTLKAIARHNRVEIPGMGTWACAGVYASVTAAGTLAVGDPVSVRR
jgi:uncharacterized protein YcbX